MEISDDLLCVFSAEITEQGGSYVLEVPAQEVKVGDVQNGGVHRVALLASGNGDSEEKAPERLESEPEPTEGQNNSSGPPVQEGEKRRVEIENLGDQGDGIARVERGYVVIVPETEKGERVVIEITDVTQNVAFAEVLERVDYYE